MLKTFPLIPSPLTRLLSPSTCRGARYQINALKKSNWMTSILYYNCEDYL